MVGVSMQPLILFDGATKVLSHCSIPLERHSPQGLVGSIANSAWHTIVLQTWAQLSLTEQCVTPHNMDLYKSSQTQPNAQEQERPQYLLRSTRCGLQQHQILVDNCPLSWYPTSSHVFEAWILERHPPGFSPCILPDTTWFQPPLCQQVPSLLQSGLVCTVWHWVADETNSQQMSTANQRWRKVHQSQGSALLWVVQVQLGLMKSCFTQKHTQKPQ